jgi:DNA repair exonuclease SbcCD nuclease subunit
MRLLCTGDLHIGRRSSGTEGREFSCGETWVRLARLAVGDDVDGVRIPRVDAVLVSGDLTDEHNRYYQAVGPVERGLEILAQAGIPTVAVAGNHDHATMADLARAFAGRYAFRVLGLGGRWEALDLAPAGTPRLRVLGWSYPRSEHPYCPLRELIAGPSELPTVGLVHVQATSGGDAYAFARPQDFRAHADVALWVTGHIHAPSFDEERGARVLNPGSPQAMDPGETGWHGAWVVEMGPTGVMGDPEPVPVSTAWYETVPVVVEPNGEHDASGIRFGMNAAVVGVRDRVLRQSPPCRRLALRLEVEGRTSVSRETLAAESKAIREDAELGFGSLEVVVERVSFARLRPAFDLERLAGELGPSGILARALLALEGEPAPGSEEAALLRELVETARQVEAHPFFSTVSDLPPMEEARVRAAAREHGYRMLEALEAQRAGWEARP